MDKGMLETRQCHQTNYSVPLGSQSLKDELLSPLACLSSNMIFDIYNCMNSGKLFNFSGL